LGWSFDVSQQLPQSVGHGLCVALKPFEALRPVLLEEIAPKLRDPSRLRSQIGLQRKHKHLVLGHDVRQINEAGGEIFHEGDLRVRQLVVGHRA
jgi:hypothetical protein